MDNIKPFRDEDFSPGCSSERLYPESRCVSMRSDESMDHPVHFSLSDCGVTDEGCAALTSALRSNPEHLRKLELTGNKIGKSVNLLSDVLKDPHCKLEILRLSDCGFTDEGCAALTSALRSNPEHLRELDLSGNKIGKSLNLLSDVLQDPHCKLQILWLSDCGLTDEGCAALTSALRSNPSHLRELSLSGNKIGKSVNLLSDLLKDLHCKLEILWLRDCGVTDEGCAALTSALRSNPSHLRELSLSGNKIGKFVILLCDVLQDPHCKLERLRLSYCGVTDEGCAALTSALRSNPSHLRELSLSGNEIGKSVNLLSDVLEDPHCKLEILWLSECGITDEGCAALSSALRSNPSHLRELDLSWNKIGNSVNLLSDVMKDPHCKLEKLRLHDCGVTDEGGAALRSNPEHLRVLGLNRNKIGDRGVKLLSAPHYNLDRRVMSRFSSYLSRSRSTEQDWSHSCNEKVKIHFKSKVLEKPKELTPEPSETNLHCQSCVHIVDCDQWVQVDPSVCTEEEGSKFRISTQAGRFECSRTRMRWVCAGDVTLQYHAVDGGFLSAELKRLQCERIGPVIDVTVISGKLEEAHLPHYVCLAESDPSLIDAVKLLSIENEGISLEAVELTRFHARILQPYFSPKTVLVKLGIPLKVHCDLLIFMTQNNPIILHVYFFPSDSVFANKIETEEKQSHQIKCSRPETPLQMMKQHSLEVPGASVQPKEIKLRGDIKPNFFQVKQTLVDDINMNLTRVDDRKSVWTSTIWKELTNIIQTPQQVAVNFDKAQFFDRNWSSFVKSVRNVNAIADKLLQKQIIHEEIYSEITHLNSTSQDSMRKICSIVRKGSVAVKEMFISVLLEENPNLLNNMPLSES